MTNEELRAILEKHYLWLNGAAGGEKADLRGVNLRSENLEGVNLRGANLRYANLRYASLKYANLVNADLTCADLTYANLKGANLENANLSYANLSETNLSEAEGILSAADYMAANFERTNEGYIAYKTFGSQNKLPDAWKIETGSVISENVNPDRCCEFGSGINVAPLENVKKNYEGAIWKVLIRWEWLPGVVVPYHTTGKVRCERVELLGVVE